LKSEAKVKITWRWWGCLAVIVVAVCLAWSNSLSAPFEFDDHESIVTNETIRSLRSLDWLSPPATGGETVSGRPFLNFTFALNYLVGGLEVRGYRLTNLLVHACGGILLFGIVRRTLMRPGAVQLQEQSPDPTHLGFPLVVAILWALHPLHTGAVTYVVQRAESLAGFFYLLTLYCFIRSVEPRSAQKRWKIAAFFACALGVATKETVVSAPLVVLLYDRAFVGGSLRVAWKLRWRTHTALLSTWILAACLALGNRGRGGSAGFGTTIEPWTYFLTQCEAITRYLRLTFWPTGQVFDYGVFTTANISAVAVELLFLGGLALVVGWGLRRNRVEGFLGACFFLALAPSSSFVPVATQTMAEHRMYLALVPPVILVCLAFRRLLKGGAEKLLVPVAVAVALSLATATFARNRVYLSGISLWEDTVTKRPANARAHNNLGRALFVAGQQEKAMAHFRQAIALQPNHAFAHANLGVALMARQLWEEAMAHFLTALQADGRYVSARVNLGYVLTQLGRKTEAIEQYRHALRDDDNAHDARINLGALLVAEGKSQEGEAMLRRVIEQAPQLAEAHYHLGLMLETPGTRGNAEAAFREAIRWKPDYAEAHLALGNVLMGRADLSGAEASYRQAIRWSPQLAGGHYALGNLLVKRQQFEPAIGAYLEALRLAPSHLQARNNLANCQLVSGKFREAIVNYETILQARPNDEAVRRNLAIAREMAGSPPAPARLP
jgi:tetratricopeptide (TPR) repeat protein